MVFILERQNIQKATHPAFEFLPNSLILIPGYSSNLTVTKRKTLSGDVDTCLDVCHSDNDCKAVFRTELDFNAYNPLQDQYQSGICYFYDEQELKEKDVQFALQVSLYVKIQFSYNNQWVFDNKNNSNFERVFITKMETKCPTGYDVYNGLLQNKTQNISSDTQFYCSRIVHYPPEIQSFKNLFGYS